MAASNANDQVRKIVEAEFVKSGLSLRGFARAIGMAPSNLSNVLSGKRPMGLAGFASVCDALGLDVEVVIRTKKRE